MKLTSWLIVFFTLAVISESQAQFTFGKNKVQHKYHQWSYIQSEHFDLYFTEGNYDMAEFAIHAAETAYTKIKKDFRWNINNRISFIIYGSHNEFQQTNTISQYLEEGIGGVTELFKNRIVLPFEGDYQQFKHVIHHELVHAVLNDMFYGGSIQNIISNNITFVIPLWFNEGLAEFSALDWDSNTDQFMRDAVINNYLSVIPALNGYFAYRGGQSVWYYITQKYGREKIAEILANMRSSRDLEQSFVQAIGLNFEELSDRWLKDLKVRYWPEIATRSDVEQIGRRLINHIKDKSNYNTSPAISPKGDRIVYITDKDRYMDVVIMNALDGKRIKKLVDGNRSRNFEELHLLTPGISWSPDSRRIAIAAKANEQDAIFLIDVQTGKEEKLIFGLDGIFSVDWSKDGDMLVFQGLKNGQSDIYLYRLSTKQLMNLTESPFSDLDPSFSHDSKKVVFISDRQNNHSDLIKLKRKKLHQFDLTQKDIFIIDIETKELTRLTDVHGVEETNPVFSPDDKHVLFISDANGSFNLWKLEIETKVAAPLTDLLQGIQQFSLTADGTKMALSVLNYAGYDIYTISNPMTLFVAGDTLTPNIWAQFRDYQFQRKFIQEPVQNSKNMGIVLSDPDTLMNYVFAPDFTVTKVTSKKDTLDFQNYSFDPDAKEEIQSKQPPPAVTFNPYDTRTPDGDFRVNDYKLNFSLDIANGTAQVSNLYGVYGQTTMMFSDMLGNHQLIFATNLVMDLKNSDYYLGYYYLPRRVDIGAFGFHFSKFFRLLNPSGTFYDTYRYRNYGIGGSFLYPMDKFNRFSLDLGLSALSRENLDDIKEPIETIYFVNPNIQYNHDTVLWGLIAPITGSRYGAGFQFVPKPFSNKLEFYSLYGDYRTYFRLSDYSSFAFRTAGAVSFGKTPQKYFIGGVENWINLELFDGRNFPITELEDFVFAQAALPLRGYKINQQNGDRYFVTNMELRFPMLFWLLPEVGGGSFQTLFMGTIFTDIGAAWSRNQPFQPWGNRDVGGWGLNDLLAGSGFGFRTYFIFLIRFDVAWNYDFRQSSKPFYYLSIGGDF